MRAVRRGCPKRGETPRHFRAALLAALLVACSAVGVMAQGPLRVEAVAGRPLGVGKITLSLPPEALPEPLGVEGVLISDRDNRVRYPAMTLPADTTLVKDVLSNSRLMQGGPVRREVGGLIRGLLDQPAPTTVYFLFEGDEPLRLSIGARGVYSATAVPRSDPRAHQRLLSLWWKQYTAKPGGLFSAKPDFPPVVDEILRAMLARRLGLTLSNAPGQDASWESQLRQQIGVFLGTEDARMNMARERMLGRLTWNEPADVPLPMATQFPPLELPEPAEEAEIEPIAMRVPVECLYVRFGSFANFLWLQDTLTTWGGDLGNLVALRGVDHETAKRMERQLILKQTALGRMLGPAVISDVALIGTDSFQREGAAFGLLFEARNTFLLSRDLGTQRTERLKAADGAKEERLTLAGKLVSYISTPDGTVRSYCAADGDYVFVTTSRTLMRRFLETSEKAGKRETSLGASAEFRHARSVMPLSRDDTVFVYLSDAFFRNMAGPGYWIEMARRLEATADIQTVELASLAAAAEGKPSETIERLVAGEFLPKGFDAVRSDGSQTVFRDGEAFDSVRGRRGSFTPIPDMTVERITPREADAYRRFVDFYHEKWGRLDPMLIGLKREALPNKQDRVTIDVQANPFARQHVERLSQWLGPADKRQLAAVPGDLAAVDLQLTNQRLFGGLRDFQLPFNVSNGQFTPIGGLRNMLVGYVGTTGSLGFLSLLDRRIPGPADAQGYAGNENGLWRHQNDRFTVFSFQSDVLREVCPELRFEQASRPAQIRLRVGDVAQARLTPALNALGYLRTRQTSLGNLRLMHALRQQLRVPGPDCRAAAELLLDAKLVCPLGGQYEYRESTTGPGQWTSTVLEQVETTAGRVGPGNVSLPEGYRAPPLNWFRGLTLDATLTDKNLSAHAELLMQLPDQPPRHSPTNAIP